MIRWFALLCLLAPALFCQETVSAAPNDMPTAIRAVMDHSQAAWNRGDLDTFVLDYEDSPDTTFMGKEVVKGGTAAILARYKRGYPTREAMGTLTYSELEVRVLAPGLALAT